MTDQSKSGYLTRVKGRTLGIVVSAGLLLTLLSGVASYLVHCHVSGGSPLVWEYRPVGTYNREIGHAYQAYLKIPGISAHEKPSPAQVLENGVPLKPGNCMHDDIRQQGMGRHSFWYDYLYFSSSDNSDPTTNGRTYEVRWPGHIDSWIFWAFLGATILFLVMTFPFAVAGIRRVIVRTAAPTGKPPFLKRFAAGIGGPFKRMAHGRNAGIVTVILIVITLVVVGISVLMELHRGGRTVLSWQRIPISPGVREIGFACQTKLPEHWADACKTPKNTAILENGAPIGPGNAMHDDIRQKGGGRFSFWYGTLYYSASDNSDPNTNGRTYEILVPTPIGGWIRWIVLITAALLVCVASLLTVLVLRRELAESGEGGRGTPGAIHTLWKGRSRLVLFLGALSVFCAIALIAGLFYQAIYHPAETAANVGTTFIFLAAHLLGGVLGYNIARFFRNSTLSVGGVLMGLVRTVGILMVAAFLLLRPSLTDSMSALLSHLPRFLVAAAVGAAFFFLRRRRTETAPDAPSAGRMLPVVMLAVILILPGVLKILAEHWDISGYMDSHSYDKNAHEILTGAKPQGDSFLMPLYQFGMAFVYFIFGHFFYVQQIVNVLMALLAAVLMTLTAWNLFQRKVAALCAGLLMAFTPELYRYVCITQIENWYIPLICLILFTWSCYWRNPRLRNAILLGLAVGLTFNCRAQGAFYFALLCLAPLFASTLPIRRRLIHPVVIGLVVAATLLPWTIRNYVYENRFSPASDQAYQSLLFNDHRLGFYGLRWDVYSVGDALNEYQKQYPDKNERFAAIQRDFYKNTFSDLGWLVRAVFWRTEAFYGLLPPGIWAEAPKDRPPGWEPPPTDWDVHLPGYLYQTFPAFFYIVFALLGLLFRPGRVTIFLFLGILANLSVLIFASQSEPRISYPVLPIHMLMGLCLFFKPVAPTKDTLAETGAPPAGRRKLFTVAGGIALLFFPVFCHLTIGGKNVYRPLMDKATLVKKDLAMDKDLPSLNRYFQWKKNPQGDPPPFKVGDRIRVVCRITNYMLPPKPSEPIGYLPDFVTSSSTPQFFYAYAEEGNCIGLAYFGAERNAVIREDDVVEAEAVILSTSPVPAVGLDFWLRVDKLSLVRNRALQPEND